MGHYFLDTQLLVGFKTIKGCKIILSNIFPLLCRPRRENRTITVFLSFRLTSPLRPLLEGNVSRFTTLSETSITLAATTWLAITTRANSGILLSDFRAGSQESTTISKFTGKVI